MIDIDKALEIAKFRDNEIHYYLYAPMGILGVMQSKEEFINNLENANDIEIGTGMCRKMSHALIVYVDNKIYYYEHDESKLKNKVLKKEK